MYAWERNNNGLIYFKLTNATVLYLLATMLYSLYSILAILYIADTVLFFVFDPPTHNTIKLFIWLHMHALFAVGLFSCQKFSDQSLTDRYNSYAYAAANKLLTNMINNNCVTTYVYTYN